MVILTKNAPNRYPSQPSLAGLAPFRFSVNTKGRDKDWDFRLLASGFVDTEGTIQDVQRYVKSGAALAAGLFGGQWRSKANVIGSQWILIDIDNSDVERDEDGKALKDADGKAIKVYHPQLTLDEALAHPFIRQHCALIYTTASHKPEWPKFRLVFILPEFVADVDEYEALVRVMMGLLPHDPACKDASRVFYGSTQATFPLVNPDATLPAEWLAEARTAAAVAKVEAEQARARAEQRRAEFRQQADLEGWDVDALVQDALGHIPPRQPGSGNYEESYQVLMALVDHYGPTEAEAIAERWSPSIKGSTWNIRQKIKSFRRGGVTIGTLFHIAKGHGFKFPKKSHTSKTRRKATPQSVEPSPAPDEITDAQRAAEALGLGMVSDVLAQQMILEYYTPGQVEHDLTIINGPYGISPADQAKLLKAGRPVLVDGRTGCGKTEMVARIRPRIEGNKLGTAATITLAGGMATRFGATPVSSQHEPATKTTWKDAVTPAESLYRSMGHDYSLWAIDEADAIFPRWLMGTLGSTGQTRNQKQVRWLGRTVPHQFYLQAQPSPVTLDAIEHFTGKRPLVVNLVREPQLESDVTVHILEDGTDRTGATLSGIATAADRALALAQAGKRSAFFGGSKDVLKALQREFRKKGIQATLRDGTYTLAPVAVGFGENPTKHCNLALITLLSRNAETGVDLQNDFDAVFALPSVQQSASEAWQHISRARSLFDGRTKDLYIHFPQDPTRFMAWEHLTPQYHLEKIKARNAYYLSLIAQGTPELREEIADLEAGFTLAARYMAEHCAGRWFQREYLLGQFEARGWPVDTIAPAPSALGFLDTLARHRDKAIDAEAFAIAKGKRHLLEYSEDRAEEIADTNKNGFVLGCYRTKLALASHFPASPLEDPKWIRANILDKPAKKAQASLLGLFTLDNAQAAVDDHTRFLQREAIKHGDDHGALSMLRQLGSSDTLPIIRLYQALSPHRGIIQAALANMATLSTSHPDALALADVLRQNADTLNQFAAKCLDDSNGFDWTEAEPMALVSKFINKYLGLPFGRAGQRRTADGTENQYQVGYCPVAIYRKANNAKGKLETWQARLDAQQALLAKRQTSKRVKPETITKIQNRIADLTATVATRMAEYQEELSQANAQQEDVAASVRPHLEMAISAAQGWMERLNFAPITKTSPVTLNAGYQSLVRGFSVTPPGNAQADPPPEPQPPETVDRATWRELREWFATAVMDGVAAIEALRDTVVAGLGAHVWQALEVAA